MLFVINNNNNNSSDSSSITVVNQMKYHILFAFLQASLISRYFSLSTVVNLTDFYVSAKNKFKF